MDKDIQINEMLLINKQIEFVEKTLLNQIHYGSYMDKQKLIKGQDRSFKKLLKLQTVHQIYELELQLIEQEKRIRKVEDFWHKLLDQKLMLRIIKQHNSYQAKHYDVVNQMENYGHQRLQEKRYLMLLDYLLIIYMFIYLLLRSFQIRVKLKTKRWLEKALILEPKLGDAQVYLYFIKKEILQQCMSRKISNMVDFEISQRNIKLKI
ncbi:unnamed protein product [Paramecium sonneborni]|uniref:Transmembrane protein n=1 Tax=Paramecium sonneborni TaxID=65129 RepID=A0A8S1JWQ5_9CILI|nr:unnamed protein product [Paramecium sonneborni]